MKKSLSSHVKDICTQILNCEHDRERKKREFIFDVILILYASLIITKLIICYNYWINTLLISFLLLCREAPE